MNKLDVAAIGGATGTITVAGVAMTSEDARGWLGVLDQAITSPGAVTMLLLGVIVCLLWLGMRGRQREKTCDENYDRLEQIVLHFMLGHPDADLVVREWSRIKSGEVKLSDILPITMPERRRTQRRTGDRRQGGFLLMEALIGMSITAISIAGLWTAVAQARVEIRKAEAAIGRFQNMLLCYTGSNPDACRGLTFVDYTTGCEYELGAGVVRKRACTRDSSSDAAMSREIFSKNFALASAP